MIVDVVRIVPNLSGTTLVLNLFDQVSESFGDSKTKFFQTSAALAALLQRTSENWPQENGWKGSSVYRVLDKRGNSERLQAKFLRERNEEVSIIWAQLFHNRKETAYLAVGERLLWLPLPLPLPPPPPHSPRHTKQEPGEKHERTKSQLLFYPIMSA